MIIEDLDALRPEAKFIRIAGIDIDVSFVPCGITFDVDRLVNELRGISDTQEKLNKLMEGGAEAKRAFEISVELCACFCSRKHPEMDVDWFYDNADSEQIESFVSAIKSALQKAYAGVASKSKNAQAPKKRTKKE